LIFVYVIGLTTYIGIPVQMQFSQTFALIYFKPSYI